MYLLPAARVLRYFALRAAGGIAGFRHAMNGRAALAKRNMVPSHSATTVEQTTVTQVTLNGEIPHAERSGLQ